MNTFEGVLGRFPMNQEIRHSFLILTMFPTKTISLINFIKKSYKFKIPTVTGTQPHLKYCHCECDLPKCRTTC